MIFSSQCRFQIECNIRIASSTHPVGDLWLWANGCRIGDEHSGVDLPLVLSQLLNPIRLESYRTQVDFERLNADEIASYFMNLVYQEERHELPLDRIGKSPFRRVVISAQNLEGFDDFFLAVIGRSYGGDRVIWRKRGERHANEVLLDTGEYEFNLSSCIRWVSDETGYHAANGSGGTREV